TFYERLQTDTIDNFISNIGEGGTFEEYLRHGERNAYYKYTSIDPLYNTINTWACQIVMLLTTGYYLTSKYRSRVVKTEIVYQSKVKRVIYELFTILTINASIIILFALSSLLFGYIALSLFDVSNYDIEVQKFLLHYLDDFRLDIYFLRFMNPLQYFIGFVLFVQLLIWLVIKITRDSFYGLLSFIFLFEGSRIFKKIYLFEEKSSYSYSLIYNFSDRFDPERTYNILSDYKILLVSSGSLIAYTILLFIVAMFILSIVYYKVRGVRI
ncbi:unnamed protein product, partial [marine sediment metagenome]